MLCGRRELGEKCWREEAGGTEIPDFAFYNLKKENWLKWSLMHALKVTREQGKKLTYAKLVLCKNFESVTGCNPGYN